MILVIIGLVICIIASQPVIKTGKDAVLIGVLSFGAILIGLGIDRGSDKAPTALDVYQGKTTLQVTYRDSVAVDSIVVFKDKK